ncbi:MAG: alpha/beta hydrolase [Planctomycetia bacterium]|nr:alpha/beta hydrolase [Planctomycetia bacterium]
MSKLMRIPIVAIALAVHAMTVCAQDPPASAAKPAEKPQASLHRSWKPTGKWKLQAQPRPAAAKGEPAPATKTAAAPASTASSDGPSSSVESNTPKTVVVSPATPTVPAAQAVIPVGHGDCDCDYWIVSSRGCDGATVPADACSCLSFFHRTSEQNLVREPGQAFLASVRPDRPVCFVVHGSYNRWRDVVAESRKIHHWLRCANRGNPLQVVFFTWPSDGNMPILLPVEIAILGRRSGAHGVYLAKLATQLPPTQQVCIVGHSHGARAAVAALHLLGGGALEEGLVLPVGCTCPPRLRAVLIAAAIDYDWLNPGQRYGQALVVPERVLLMRNSRDSWLTMYPARKWSGERALGKDGLGQDDRLALGPLGAKVVELNSAEFTTWHHSFSDFHQRPELATAMLPYVYFQEDPHPAGAAPAITPVPTPVSVTPPASPHAAPEEKRTATE